MKVSPVGQPRVAVEYIRGPLDGLCEEISSIAAATPMLIGPDNSVPPEGWYAPNALGKRYWHEGPPPWWKVPTDKPWETP
jgi:hypothetical protein